MTDGEVGGGDGGRNTAERCVLLEASVVEIKVISVNVGASFR